MLHLKILLHLHARCVTNEHVDTAENLDITMPDITMYNLIQYSDNYLGISGSLWLFKRDETHVTDAGNPDNVPTNNSSSYKYKSSILKKPADGV